MTNYQFRKAMRILDHAIDHLGPTRPCFLLIENGKMFNLAHDNRNVHNARTVLVDAMLKLARERG
jgi:hypothetical protein